MEELNSRINASDFWTNHDDADKIVKRVGYLKNIVNNFENLNNSINSNIEVIDDEDFKEICEKDYLELSKQIEHLELETYLSGEYDQNNCILEIHAGAGGTEAQDWAMMLYRMYQRYCKKVDYKIQELDCSYGDEVGIKSVAFKVSGMNAYGYLKGEKGIHRLVRISPFDSNKRRHTSFASVDVIPEIDNSIDIVIDDKDLRIDIYRSSGPGGQGVNTTDSAVRITHIPTGIVTTCQNERSQIQNKEQAINILKNKLKLIEIEKTNEKINGMKDDTSIGFGSNKRSYVMCPYTLVKDNDTNYETSNVDAVLDGELDAFILEELRRG